MGGWLDKFIYRLYRKGELRYLTIGSGKSISSVTAYAFDTADKILLSVGTVVPGGVAGFSKGALFIKTDAGAGVRAIYENIGTTTVASFNLIGSIVPAEITLAEGNVMVGNAASIGVALDGKTLGSVLIGNGTTVVSTALATAMATAITLAQGEVMFAAAGPTIDGLQVKALGTLITGDATNAVVVTIAAGEVVAGGVAGIDGVALATGSILRGSTGALPTALDLKTIGSVLTGDGTTVGGIVLARKEILYNTGVTLDGLAIVAGDLITADATDVAKVSIAAGEVVVGATGPVIDGVALATGSILKGATGATPVAQAMIAGDILIGTSAAGVSVLNIPAGSLPYFNGTDLAALALAASSLLYTNSGTTFLAALAVAIGDIVTANATDIAVVNLATGSIVIGSAAGLVALDGSTDGAILIGNGTTMTAQTLAGGVITLTNAGVTAFVAGAIVDADVNAAAAIAGSKIHPFFNHMVGLYGAEQVDATAGDVQYSVAQITGLALLRDTGGGNRTDTFPDADDLIAGITGVYVGMSWYVTIHNNSGGANTIQIAAGVNCDLHPAAPATIGQNVSQTWLFIIENIGGGTEEYAAYLVSVT